MVEWSPLKQEDLLWWSNTSNLLLGVSLEEIRPDLLFWSDASDQGWGARIYRTISFRPFGLRWSAPFRSTFWSSERSTWVYSTSVTRCGVLSWDCSRTTPALFRMSGGPASPSLGRGAGDHSGSPIHYGGPEYDRRLSELPTSGPGV